MLRNKFFIFMGALLIMMTSCKDEDLAPIITFDQAGKGGYVALISETDKLINLLDVPSSVYTYSVEFIDLEQGNLVSAYVLDLVYVDNDPSNGDNSVGPIEFRRYTPSDFAVNGNGLQGIENISISGTEVIAAAGTTADAVTAGDQFRIVGRLELSDGQVFGAANSSAAVNGAAFRGHFNFTLPAGCPSDLSGTYDYATSAIWCGAGDVTGSVDVTNSGGGVHQFSDWSFGAYGACYGAGSVATNLEFQEICEEVIFVPGKNVNQFGDTYTLSSEIVGEDWVITWSNDYGESGVAAITFPGGVPFTLK